MKQLPKIGSEVLTRDGIKGTIINHFDDKAVFLYHNNNGFLRADIAVASWFKEIEPEQTEEPNKISICDISGHNYVQMAESQKNKAFCTRCGHIIPLE